MKITGSKFVGSYPRYDLAPSLGVPEIAFGGKSNVGKSSLINSLLNRKNLAQISKTPGKTRLLNLFVVSGGNGKPMVGFMDLPGYGYAKVSTSLRREWQAIIEGYIENSAGLKGFILLIDSRRGVEDRELQLIDYLIRNGRRVCPVLTKSDKLKKNQIAVLVREATAKLISYGDRVHYPILHSSKSGQGNDLIWRWMNERIRNES